MLINITKSRITLGTELRCEFVNQQVVDFFFRFLKSTEYGVSPSPKFSLSNNEERKIPEDCALRRKEMLFSENIRTLVKLPAFSFSL